MKIETKRLILREFQLDDWPAVMAYHADVRYQRYYPQREVTAVAAQAFVQMFLDQQAEQPRTKFQLAVTLKSNHILIGNCGIRKASAEAHQADLGYELAPEHWGNGYATEAAQAMLHFGFAQLKLHRVWAECIAENSGSARVLEKLGMKLEGRLRDDQWFNGRYWDTFRYGILSGE